MSGRHPVLEGAAKAYWASGYADAVDNWDEDNPDVEETANDVLGPGAGGDWMDVLPPMPAVAYQDAKKALDEVLLDGDNPPSLDKLMEAAEDADGAYIDPEELGHYIAMQAMGHGVSWWDVGVPFHAPFDMTIGHHEGWRTGEAAYDAVVEEMG